MNIKRIVAHHKAWCTYCKQQDIKTSAVWRLTLDNKVACEEHKQELVDYRDKCRKLDSRDYSEADYQTWLRL